MTTHQKCVGLFGWLFGHRMDSNHSTRQEMTEPDFLTLRQHPFPEELVKECVINHSTYINSICRRCGMVVEKKDKGEMV